MSETRYAIDWIHWHLDENELEVENLLVKARNNWVYYIYEFDISIEKVNQVSIAAALECIEYLEQRAFRFPELTGEITDTIQKVATRFRATTFD